jgi:hypothetical protein
MIFGNPVDALRVGAPRVARGALAGLAMMAVGATAAGAYSALDGTPARAAGSPPPASVAARLLPADKPPFSRAGTIVSSSSLGVRVFVNATDGFALATTSLGGATTYPATTVNAGKTWRIDGPHFHVSAADAPDIVTQVGAASPAMYFAYGGPEGAESIVVTSDGGRQWWRAYLPGVPEAVVYGRVSTIGARGLLAFVQAGPGGEIWAYVSTDGGRRWSYR